LGNRFQEFGSKSSTSPLEGQVLERKRARQAAKANSHNSALRSKFRTAIKAVRKAIDAGDKAKAAEIFKASSKTIDIIADKSIVHKNKAARHKSRLAAAIKGLQASAAQ
jgi:small subunit ribosomal protein S20